MKPLTIKLNDAAEAGIIEKALIAATGEKKSVKPAKYVFVSEDGKVKVSNDDLIYQKRIEHNITVIDALSYLQSLVDKKPFLIRSGIKSPIAGKIDQGIKDQFASMCRQNGYKPDERFENLLAADIKCRIHGMDLVEVVKERLNV